MNSNLDLIWPNPPKPFYAVHPTQPRKREHRGTLKYENSNEYWSGESSGGESDADAPNGHEQNGPCEQKRRPMSVS